MLPSSTWPTDVAKMPLGSEEERLVRLSVGKPSGKTITFPLLRPTKINPPSVTVFFNPIKSKLTLGILHAELRHFLLFN